MCSSDLRVKQNFWRESSVGLIATLGDPLGRGGSWLAGPDLTLQTSRFRGNKNLRAGAWALAMGRDGARGDRTASGFRVDYPNDLWSMFWSTMRVGDGFDPSLGFVPRASMYYHRLTAEYAPRFNNGWLRQMQNEFQAQLWTDLQGRWESYRVQTAPINWRFNSGDRIEFNYAPTGETLSKPFAVADNVTIPVGRYTWTRWRLEGQAAAKRAVSGQLTWWFGGFYGGTLNQIIWTGTWHPSALVALELTGEHDTGDLPQEIGRAHV